MPSLGADMDAGTILEWRVAPGDTVSRGDIVAVVSTEKSDIDVEVFESGVVEELLVPPGEEVPVGTPLARIAGAGSAPEAVTAEEAPPRPTGSGTRSYSPLVRHLAEQRHIDLSEIAGTGPGGRITRADVERASAPPVEERAPARPTPRRASVRPAEAGERVRASPLARRLARDKGVDLAGVAGSGPGGAVVAGDLADLADLERRAPTKEARPEPEPPRAPSPGSAEDRRAALRRSIGDLMARSKREIPHYYLSNTIDLRAATEWLSAANAGRPVSERILPAALLFRAVTLACASNPSMNGHWVDGELRHSDEVDLGVAISLRGGGLVAPTILGAESLGVDEIMARLNGLVERARAGRLLSSEMTDPTITITNLGDQGSEAVFGVIYPPQVALVGFGRIVERPWAVDGMLAVRPVVTATLAADHRASDGHDGARFLASIERLLQDPEKL